MTKMTPAQERRYVKEMVASIAARLIEQWSQPPNPMAPDYPTLAAEELTSQVEDCRDSAEVAGAQ